MGNLSKKELAFYKPYFWNGEWLKNELLHIYVVDRSWLLIHTVCLLLKKVGFGWVISGSGIPEPITSKSRENEIIHFRNKICLSLSATSVYSINTLATLYIIETNSIIYRVITFYPEYPWGYLFRYLYKGTPLWLKYWGCLSALISGFKNCCSIGSWKSWDWLNSTCFCSASGSRVRPVTGSRRTQVGLFFERKISNYCRLG